MPKKLGTNPKALEARERKANQKKDQHEKASKAAQDALWRDDDKLVNRKANRKEEEERKKAEVLKRKMEKQALLEQEMAALKPAPKQSIQKITQAQIRREVEHRNKVIENLNKPATESNTVKLVNDEPLIENLNRLEPDVIEASGFDQVYEAIASLSVASKDGADKHPEKRLKAAYKAYEAENLPRIKSENPSMRLSQWKQLLFREWTKSPQNPLNQ